MHTYDQDVIIRQIGQLPGDLQDAVPRCYGQILERLPASLLRSARLVCLLGSGDSCHAAFAAKMAFEELAGIACQVANPQHFIDYLDVWRNTLPAPGKVIVVATSASGSTPLVVQAVERTREAGVSTIVITGKADSPLSKTADHSVVVELAHTERSPGIRTYQASFTGMVLLAIRMAEVRRKWAVKGRQLRDELGAIPEIIAQTARLSDAVCRRVAESVSAAPVVMVLGNGPGYGTARYCAAKMQEAAGLCAVGQDMDGWWHGERFAYPADMPVFVIAPRGLSYRRGCELAAAAGKLGRRVYAVARQGDTEIGGQSGTLIPVFADVREVFSPFLYHIFANYLSYYIAVRNRRALFGSNPPDFLKPLK